MALQGPSSFQGPSILGQSGRRHAISCSSSDTLHLSRVPLMQTLVCLCCPGPQVSSSPVDIHSPWSIHSPCFLGQSGRLQESTWCRSSSEHLFNVPSMQVRNCLCFPGPHDSSLPTALHGPSLVHLSVFFSIEYQ